LAHHLASQFSSGTFRVLVYFLQSLLLTVYPVPLTKFLNFVAVHIGSPGDARCPFPMSPVFRMVFNTMTPFAFVVSSLLLNLFFHIPQVQSVVRSSAYALLGGRPRPGKGPSLSADVPSVRERQDAPSQMTNDVVMQRQMGRLLSVLSRHSFWRSMVLLLLVGYQIVLNNTFFFFSCRKVAGEHLNSFNPAVSCSSTVYSDLYYLFVPLAILLTSVCILMPVILWFFIYKVGHVPPALMVIIEPYKPGWPWFWECVVNLRKVSMTVAFVSFFDDSDLNVRRTALGIVHTVFLILHQIAKPYKQAHLNHLESLALGGLVIVAFLVGTDDINPRHFWAWTAVTIIVSVCVVGSMVFRTLVFCRRVRKNRVSVDDSARKVPLRRDDSVREPLLSKDTLSSSTSIQEQRVIAQERLASVDLEVLQSSAISSAELQTFSSSAPASAVAATHSLSSAGSR
jgi:hypothetical protein